MAKIAFFSPRAEMISQARNAAKNTHLDIVEFKLISTPDTIQEANRAVREGADIIIARGVQAALIQYHTNIPVVTITLTGQEIASLISQAKKILQISHPSIAIVGNCNMFGDISSLGEIFDVQLIESYVTMGEEIPDAVDRAVTNGAQIIIGGDTAIRRAQEIGVPSLFLTSTISSINEVFRIAEIVSFSMDQEKTHSAELSALLDYSFSGIIKINEEGKILILNHIAKELLDLKEDSNIGAVPITTLIPQLDESTLQQVLVDGKELYSVYITTNKTQIIANLIPIKVGVKIDGAIFAFQEIKKLKEINDKINYELYQSGCVAEYNFDQINGDSAEIAEVIRQAKLFALNDIPLLITGEPGTEKEMLAQAIHNGGKRCNKAFVSVDCAAMTEEEQFATFSKTDNNASTTNPMKIASGGTLFISHIDQLSQYSQSLLCQMLKNRALIQSNGSILSHGDVRFITASDSNLGVLVHKGQFNLELYYLLSTLTLCIPPLRARKSDISIWVEQYIKEICSQYSRYLVLTSGAKQALLQYPWPGNLIELKSFCERLVIMSTHRSISEDFILDSLRSTAPDITIIGNSSTVSEDMTAPNIVYRDPKADGLQAVLKKYHGNRTLAAQELNMSKTTLWRKIRKYNLPSKY